MKLVAVLLFLPGVCLAGEMVTATDADMKLPDPDYVKIREEVLPKLDLTQAKDRESLEILEREMYMAAMLKVGEPFFRTTVLTRGDDWRQLWRSRQQRALDELKGEEAKQASLRRAFEALAGFIAPDEAVVLERVVSAKFGDEPVWILLVRADGADSVARRLETTGSSQLGEFLVTAFRVSDQKLISRALSN